MKRCVAGRSRSKCEMCLRFHQFDGLATREGNGAYGLTERVEQTKNIEEETETGSDLKPRLHSSI